MRCLILSTEMLCSQWLKNNNTRIRKFYNHIAKPQQMLFDIVKTHYPTAILEYKVHYSNDRFIYLDIAIPELKINIEYDGMHEHSTNQAVAPDRLRDVILKELGWRVYRFQYRSNPTREKLLEHFNREFNIGV